MRRLLIGILLVPGLTTQAADDDSLIERGRYLARTADCAACHTAEGGAPFAGGVPIASPFGTIYGTNITPDPDYGIGEYSADDFYHALTEGETPSGRQLYPAMPYTSYHLMRREDADAIYAFLMSREPIARAAPETDLSFPYNQRWGVAFWNLIYADALEPDASSSQSSAWQRGQYLVEAMGHCGECHTPRSWTGAMDLDRHLEGGSLAGYRAPSLEAEALADRGWNRDDLAHFLKHGMSPQGSVFNEMFPVMHHSTQYLTDEDLSAMATYLLGDTPPEARRIEPRPLEALSDSARRGRQSYLDTCAGCHGGDGQGKPQVAVAMSGNTTLRLEDPTNLLRVMLDGIEARDFPGFARMQEMPGFAAHLSDDELADLGNYLRETWGGRPGDIAPGDVANLREHNAHAAP
ncbi:cytochrome c [Halomonas sp. I1]|uniref:cytochrome c n=1 Tax=Halomonas sp. I1 TaxID=393536 RepID=UPI0028DFAC59|nr:cytochrome c [Halomonas sp. I1]MDT8894824.1 cytochrome c [Halomonas sp. I1]